ncbi:MAG: hypothetical protein ACI97K_002855, partial [Glaciecola sp.]
LYHYRKIKIAQLKAHNSKHTTQSTQLKAHNSKHTTQSTQLKAPVRY